MFVPNRDELTGMESKLNSKELLPITIAIS
jgi:hypothetical protein